jgi:hypothetical protein
MSLNGDRSRIGVHRRTLRPNLLERALAKKRRSRDHRATAEEMEFARINATIIAHEITGRLHCRSSGLVERVGICVSAIAVRKMPSVECDDVPAAEF